jgi:hypothetical protein
MEDIYLKFKRTDIYRFIPTMEELEQDIALQTQMQIATMKKMALAEEMQAEMGSQQPQEQSDAVRPKPNSQ